MIMILLFLFGGHLEKVDGFYPFTDVQMQLKNQKPPVLILVAARTPGKEVALVILLMVKPQ